MDNLELYMRLQRILDQDKNGMNMKFRNHIEVKFYENPKEFLLDNEQLKIKINKIFTYFNDPKNIETKENNFKKQYAKKTDETEINIENKKSIILTIANYSELILAIKCILWSLDNKPSTTKKLLDHIMIINDQGDAVPILETITNDDYSLSNTEFRNAVSKGLLNLNKIKNVNNTLVYLYSNPTNKRQGYFYKGQLCKLKDLSLINGTKPGTIQRRFQNYSIEQSIL